MGGSLVSAVTPREGPLIPRTARCRPPLDGLPPNDQAPLASSNPERGDTGNAPLRRCKHTTESDPPDNEEQGSAQPGRRDCQKVLHKKHENRGSRRRPARLHFSRNINLLIGNPQSTRRISREPMVLRKVTYPLRDTPARVRSPSESNALVDGQRIPPDYYF